MFEFALSYLNLEHFESISNPVVGILGGQPGSGKSSICRIIKSAYDGNIVILNGDDFKSLYPNYDSMLIQAPIKTMQIVQPYSNYVVEQLKNVFIKKRVNLLIEGTMRTTAVPLQTIKFFKEQKYLAEIHIVSTNYYASLVSCIERFELDLANSGAGRNVERDIHDQTYKKIPDTVSKILDTKLVDKAIVYNRYGQILSSKISEAKRTYLNHRKQITNELYIEILSQLHNAINLKNLRNAPLEETLQLEEISSQLTTQYHLHSN